jgi:hypothetical protein
LNKNENEDGFAAATQGVAKELNEFFFVQISPFVQCALRIVAAYCGLAVN